MLPVILIFDIGKTNKKVLLFNRAYNVVYEEEISIPSIADEDGFLCDDLAALVSWVQLTTHRLLQLPEFDIRAINFSTFGASLVHLDLREKVLTPLYNYLKPLDEKLVDEFYSMFGGREAFSIQTGSPAVNMLNSGIQLFWLQQKRPELFRRLAISLHLPQYLSYAFTKHCLSEYTSIGCHTGLWDFSRQTYHEWINNIQASIKLPEPVSSTLARTTYVEGKPLLVGPGIHDSSASLIPFEILSSERVAILSTGTWNVTLIPKFSGELTQEDYRQDCLYFLSANAEPVAAARIFLGNEFEVQVRRLQQWFKLPENPQVIIEPDDSIFKHLIKETSTTFTPQTMAGSGPFPAWRGGAADLTKFSSFKVAYHKLILDLAWMQKVSMDLLFAHMDVNSVYVTGGFTKNLCFMQVLQQFFPEKKFFTASINNGSALGAAMILHELWNPESTIARIKTQQLLPVLETLDLSEYRLSPSA